MTEIQSKFFRVQDEFQTGSLATTNARINTISHWSLCGFIPSRTRHASPAHQLSSTLAYHSLPLDLQPGITTTPCKERLDTLHRSPCSVIDHRGVASEGGTRRGGL
ncbi:hypothetical protein E2C01_080968 [Portunus trituberculatus]|uniref:Uncharacterized protein n=1 Tax=Portunus trituberculatus TaxID=210409 RepID=A0A5B7IQR5_PORTR|nr:hypothetical protein [Portunus trituberculatus]